MSTPIKPSLPSAASAKRILNPLKRLIASPYGIAAIASLSFHGVMFAAAPRFSAASFEAFSEGNGEEVDRTVPLVALTPAEQSRLPNFNRPSLPTIPDITSSTTLRTLPNATTLTRPRVTTPRLPSSSSSIFNRSGSSSSRPSRSSLGTLNRGRSYNNPYNLPTINPPTRSSRSSNNRTTSPRNIPAPPGDIGLRLGTERPRDLEAELEVERQADAAAAAAAEAEAEAAIANQGELAPGLPELPPQSENGSEAETPDPDSEDLVAINDPDIEEREPTQLERLQADFKYDPAGTSEDDANAEYAAWATPPEGNSGAEGETEDVPEGETGDAPEGEAEGGDTEGETAEGELANTTAEFGVIELEALSLCVDTPPNNGLVGILVAPDGTREEPVMFRSTGYDYLNQQAKDTLRQTDFPATDATVRYPFDVVVNYDPETCQSSADIINTAQNN